MNKLLLALPLASSLLLAACEAPQRPHSIAADPAAHSALVGRPFPAIHGTGLDKREWKIPADMLVDDNNKPRPILLLIAYEQDAQFDLDRWELGLAQANTPIALFELPCIRGWLTRQFSSHIDSRMRTSVPKEHWSIVATVYNDASTVADFTGDDNPANGRIILLKPDGTVAWFWDAGYSPTHLLELDAAIRAQAQR